MNDAPGLAGVFLLPLGHDVVVGRHVEQMLEDEWETLGRRLLQREDFHEIIVHAQMPAMAFEMGFREAVIEKRVVFPFCVIEFLRVKVQRAFQNAERFVFRENSDGQEIADLGSKTSDFLAQRRFCPSDLPAVEANGSLRREARA